jgi:hypothetical protein
MCRLPVGSRPASSAFRVEALPDLRLVAVRLEPMDP